MRPELLVGIDFAGPATAAGQRRKIVALAAERIGPHAWRIAASGLNARVARAPAPGWTALELAEALLALPCPAAVVAADFPFSLPRALLRDPAFARLAGHDRPFATWSAFNRHVARHLPLECPVDYRPFDAWRDRRFWLLRSSDVAARAQPALKHRFQVLFNMTLLGNAFLARLARSGRYRVLPFGRRGAGQVIEIYPGLLLRQLGLPGYKRQPAAALAAVERHLAGLGIVLSIDGAIRRRCLAHDTGTRASPDHDCADALVATGGAILFREGWAAELLGADPRARRTEGAIWGARLGVD